MTFVGGDPRTADPADVIGRAVPPHGVEDPREPQGEGHRRYPLPTLLRRDALAV